MATLRQKKVAKTILESNGSKSVSQAMRESGYPAATAKNPQQLTRSKGWNDLMEDYLGDENLSKHHKALLEAKKVEHMTFPLGPKGEDDLNLSGATPNANEGDEKFKERTTLTDQEIKEMLAEVGCKVKRIVHGDTARHVYFWASDNKARKEALDMAYKLKGKYAPEKHVNLNVEIEATEKIRQATHQLNELYRTGSIGSDGAPASALDNQAQD